MPKIKNNKIIWDSDDWLGGLDETSTATVNKKGVGIANSQQVDPLRAVGYISPGFAMSNVTNYSSVTATILNGVVVGASAYAIGSDSSVYKIDSLNIGSIDTVAPFPHTITHGAHTSIAGSDIVNYYVGSTLNTFYSFKDATDWDVGMYNQAGTFDDDYMSTAATSPLAAPYITGGKDSPHPMIVGDDDVLYIGDRNYLHGFDGQLTATGTFEAAVLTLPMGYTITGLAKTSDYRLAIAAYYTSAANGSTYNKGEAKVFIWDYLSLDPVLIYDLHDNYVSDLINWRGTLVAFTQGRQTITQPYVNKLQVLSGGQFTVLTPYGSGTTSSIPVRGGSEVVNDDIYFNVLGKIYVYGKIPNTDRYILNSPFGAPDGNSGMLKVFSSSLNFMYSLGTGNLKGLVRASSGTYANGAVLNTKVAYPFTNERKRGRIKSITVKFSAAVTDANARQFQLTSILDKGGTSAIVNTATPTVGIQEIYFSNADGSNLGDFSSMALEVLWSGGTDNTKCPIIETVIADYEEINITSP